MLIMKYLFNQAGISCLSAFLRALLPLENSTYASRMLIPRKPARGLRFAHDCRTRQPLPEATDKPRSRDDYRDSPEWFIADTVLSLGGTIAMEGKSIRDRAELSKRRFEVEEICCPDGFEINPFLADRIKELKGLRRIKLTVNRPDAKVLAQLGTLPQLEAIDLTGSNLTDQSCMLLQGFEDVQSINISDTSITARGAEDLQPSLYKARILWNSRENDRDVATRLLAKNATLGIKVGQRELQLQPSVWT
jgi:hypothetical protein